MVSLASTRHLGAIGPLIEVLSGESPDTYFDRHIFGSLGMQDTFFHVPADKQHRLATHYVGDLVDPSGPGLASAEHLPFPGAYRQAVPRLTPGGGLVSSLSDYTRLVQVLANGGAPLLDPATMEYITRSQIPAHMPVGFPELTLTGRGHSFAASVFRERTDMDPCAEPGDVQWNGLSGTQWMFSPGDGFGLVLMTQRYFGFGLPCSPKFKQAGLSCAAGAVCVLLHAASSPQKTDSPVLAVNSSSAFMPSNEFPVSSRAGDQTHSVRQSGITATMPPPTPLLHGSPTRKANSPAAS